MKQHGFSGKLWPVHVKPKADEILSSWLVRLAMAHGQKLHTFCSISWPEKSIWNRDIDKSADEIMVRVLSNKTGTPIKQVLATILATYEGVLYEKHNHLGPTAWLMPIGIYHRTRRCFGMQYCPYCLETDEIPYYRRRWRLAFMTVCEEHHVQLQDRCPKCGAAINFHRNELGDHRKLVGLSLTLCHVCGLDLRTADELVTCKDRQALIAKLDEVNFEKGLLRALNSGFVKLSEDLTIYSMLYFTGLRHLMKILAMCNKRIETLRHAIAESYGVAVYTPPPSHPDVQELNTTARRQLLGLARCLLEEWPHRFIELSQRCKVWSALWLRHLEPYSKGRVAPFWFWSVVHAHLYRARYCPSNEEVKAATAHLKNRGRILTDSSLSRLLGVSVLPRRKAL